MGIGKHICKICGKRSSRVEDFFLIPVAEMVWTFACPGHVGVVEHADLDEMMEEAENNGRLKLKEI